LPAGETCLGTVVDSPFSFCFTPLMIVVKIVMMLRSCLRIPQPIAFSFVVIAGT